MRQISSQKHTIATIIFINDASRPDWQHSWIRSSIKKLKSEPLCFFMLFNAIFLHEKHLFRLDQVS